MGILAVTQIESLLQGNGHLLGKSLLILAQILSDSRIISGDMLERLLCQLLALIRPYVTLAELSQHQLIVRRINHHQHIGEVLGRRTNHSRAADVDILQCLVQTHPRFGYRLPKRIEIHHHHIDKPHLILVKLSHMGTETSLGQDSAMHRRMQCLHPAIQDLGETR